MTSEATLAEATLGAPQSATQRIERLHLLLAAALGPLFFVSGPWTPFAAVLLVGSWVVRGVLTRRLVHHPAADAANAGLVLMAAVGVAVSIDPRLSTPKFWAIFYSTSLFYTLLNDLNTRALVHVAAGVIVAGTAVLAVLSLPITDWNSFQFYNILWLTERIPTFTSLAQALPTGGIPRNVALVHPREVGGAVGTVLPLAITLLWFGRGRALRLAAALSLPALAFILFIAQSMSALAGVAMAVALIVIWRFRRSRWVAPACAAVLLAALAVLAPRLTNATDQMGAGIAERATLWMWGLEALRQEPFTGLGLNGFDYVMSGLYTTSSFFGVNHSHNLVLQAALDLGIPGLLAFLALLTAAFVVLWRLLRATSDPTSQAVALGLAAGLVSYLGFGTVDASLGLGWKPGVLLWAMLGGAFALARLTPTPAAGRWTRPALLGIGSLAGVALLALLPSLPGLASRNAGVVQGHQALAVARATGTLPTDRARSALAALASADQQGQGTAHTHFLQGSLNGWLGNCEATQQAFLTYVLEGTELPVGGRALAAGVDSGKVALGKGLLGPLATRMRLPRPPEEELHWQRDMLGVATRFGPYAAFWEPYFIVATLLEHRMENPVAAQEFLDRGAATATNPAPLQCYRIGSVR